MKYAKLLLEFTKDVENDKELRDAFSKPRVFIPKMKRLQVYFFDKENVVISKCSPGDIEGELTGVKGDAFRLIVAPKTPADIWTKAKKAAIRQIKLGTGR